VALLLASRGMISPPRMWQITLAPSAGLFLVGVVLAAVDEGRVRRARKVWFDRAWSDDLVADEIRTWRTRLAAVRGLEAPEAPGARIGSTLQLGAWVAVALAVLVAVPVMTLLPTSVIGPVLATIQIPRFSSFERRAAEMEALRRYGVPHDSAVSAEEAGRLLHDILYAGGAVPREGELPPSRSYAEPLLPPLPAGDNPVGAEPHRWALTIFSAVTERSDPELLAFLDSMARHPAHEAFSRLARAPAIDVAAARWKMPFPSGMTIATIPIPRLTGLRQATYAHFAVAADDLAHGRPEAAEARVREVISVGLLLGDQGPTLIDNLIGSVVARAGGDALEALYSTTGRDADAEALHEARDAMARALKRIRPPPESAEGYVRALPGTVLDEGLSRGLRWESLVNLATLSPCLNMHRMVFGPGPAYRDFLRRAEDALVAWPSNASCSGWPVPGTWAVRRPAAAPRSGAC